MRKIGSLILAVILLVSCFSFAVYAEEDSTRYDYYLNTAAGLGVIVPSADLGLDGSLYLTRGEFMDIVANLLGLAEVNTGFLESPFADVEGDHASLLNLITLADMGYINGDENGNANLDNPITQMEALKVLVRVAGYGDLALINGGYPAGYRKYANDLDLTTGIVLNEDSPVTYGVLARMIYNLFDVRILEMTGLADNGDMTFALGDTVLYEYLGVIKGEGVVEQNAVSGITSAEGAGEGRITINGNTYNSGNYNEYLGYNVEYFYDKEDNIVYLAKNPNKNVTTIIEVDDFVRFENGAIQYYNEKDKLTTVGDVGALDVIYNGKHSVNWVNPLVNLKEGQLTLLDNDNDDDYEILLIDSYATLVVDSIDKKNDIIYGKYNASAVKMMEDYDDKNLTVIGADGNEITFDELKEWDVLSVRLAEDNGSGIIYVSTGTITGTITAMNNSKKEISIDGAVYKMEDNFFEQNKALIKVGDSSTFYLNRFGKLAAKYTGRNAIFQYGYIIDTASFPDFMEMVVQLKLFTEAGEIKIFDLDDKVTVDGVAGIKSSDILSHLQQDKDGRYNQVIIYKTNSEGKINYIDTTVKNDAYEDINTIRPMYTEGGSLGFQPSTMGFSDKFFIDDSTVVFIIPSDSTIESAEARDFSVSGSGYFKNYTNYYPEAYTVGDTYKAQIIILRTSTANASLSTSDTISIVTGVSDVLVDGEITKEYTVIKDNAEVKVTVDSEYNGVLPAEGDVMRYKVNRFGYLDMVEMIYDFSEKTYLLSNPYGSYDPVLKFVIPHSRRDNILKVSIDDPATIVEESAYSYYNLGSAQVYRLDAKSDGSPEVKTVTANDVMTYEHSKSIDEKIILYMRENTRVVTAVIVDTGK